MEHPDRALLAALRHALLRLHKTLLDWERVDYERVHGRTEGHALLQALLHDPQFAWLRPLSELIVRIDELLEADIPDIAEDAGAIVGQLRVLIAPGDRQTAHAQRYQAALQEHPDAVVAHRDVVDLLKMRDAAAASQRPH